MFIRLFISSHSAENELFQIYFFFGFDHISERTATQKRLFSQVVFFVEYLSVAVSVSCIACELETWNQAVFSNIVISIYLTITIVLIPWRQPMRLIMLYCTVTEFFWSLFSPIRTEYRDLQNKSPYSVRMRVIRTRKTPNTDTFHAEYDWRTCAS